MAFFGITDVIFNLEHKEKQEVFTSRIGSVLPSLVLPALSPSAKGWVLTTLSNAPLSPRATISRALLDCPELAAIGLAYS